MLVLTRPVGAVLHIGDAITVAVVAVKGSQVRAAIGAPFDIPILRSALAERTESERCSTSCESDRATHRPNMFSDGRRD